MQLTLTQRVITAKPVKAARLARRLFHFLTSSSGNLRLMPLPPAPTKRAALLPPEASTLRPVPRTRVRENRRRCRADSPLAEKPQALDFDPRGGGELHPEAFREDTGHTELPELALTKSVRPSTQPAPRPARKAKPTGPAKLFVLDTNVLMHDPMSLFRFEEHDIFLPMIVLEELDGPRRA